MKRVIALTLFGVMVAVPTYAQTRNVQEQEVLKASQVLDEASLIKKDRATMERLYADDYMYFHSNGTVANKAEAKGPWTSKAPMPTARSSPVVGVIDGLLYVAGGGGSSNPPFFATLEAYNPATNNWTTRSPMPTPRLFAVGGVVNGVLYVAGGSGYQAFLTPVEAYNPALDTLGKPRHQAARPMPPRS